MFDFNGPYPPEPRRDLKRIMDKLGVICPQCGEEMVIIEDDHVEILWYCLNCDYDYWEKIKRV